MGVPSASCLLFFAAAGVTPATAVDARPTWRSETALGIQTPIAFLAPSDVSVGLVLRGRLELRVADATTIGLRVASLGLGFGRDSPSRAGSREGDILSMLGWAYAEWDPGPIALAVGLGGATLSRRTKTVDSGASLLTVLGLRLGRQDGLLLRLSAGIQSFEESTQPGFAELEVTYPSAIDGASWPGASSPTRGQTRWRLASGCEPVPAERLHFACSWATGGSPGRASNPRTGWPRPSASA